MILAFIMKNWKTIGIALVVGVLIAGVATLYGSLQIQKGLAAKYKSERDAARTMTEIVTNNLNKCVDANEQWSATADEWNQSVRDLEAASDSYRNRYFAERSRRMQLEEQLADAHENIDSSVTSEVCEDALNQLISALGWSGQ